MTPSILITGGAGYIGSRLINFFEDADSLDLELHGNPDGLPNCKQSYQSLRRAAIEPYDVVIHLAAHSSVAMCNNDPEGAVHNNITGFAHLLNVCKGKRLIYASSASVYNGSGEERVDEEWDGFRPSNRYDVSKYAMDMLAQTSDVEFYGLRLGTVCGWSPNLRTDVMINRMEKDARETGMVTMTNPCAHRAVLDIDDLCRAVQRIVTGERKPGIYNLASFNATVNAVAMQVADYCGAGVKTAPSQQTYDFSMSSEKFRHAYRFEFCGKVPDIVAGLAANPPVIAGGRS